MSSPSAYDDAALPRKVDVWKYVQTGVGALVDRVRALSFWSAIALPFVHVPFLMTGLETPAETMAFLALLALNVLTLVAGHSHGD